MIRLKKSFVVGALSREMSFKLPTWITLIRLFLVPVIVIAMIEAYWGVAFWLFIIAVVSDIADGIIARACNMKTFIGACLDAITDKVLILSVYFTLAFVQTPLFTLPLWFVLLVLLKEFLLIGGAAAILLTRGTLAVEPNWLGKATMVAQSLFIIWLFFCYFFQWMPERTYYGALGVLLTLVILSLINYAMVGFSLYRK